MLRKKKALKNGVTVFFFFFGMEQKNELRI